MALNSPGVEVDIIDQSQTLPAASSSVPLLILATAQNKADATSNTGAVAAGTLQANANKLYQITSQKDILSIFGSPFFYKTSNGTPIQGYELNEYGLLAAYSLMGLTNSCYILRADIDMGALVGALNRPVGAPSNGTYWLDTTSSTWGIFEFDATNQVFNSVTPSVITDTAYITSGYPSPSFGSIGSYAVIPNQVTSGKSYSAGTYFRKDYNNNWQIVGSPSWKAGLATVTGSVSNAIISASGTFTINLNGKFTRTISVTSGETASSVASAINNLGAGHLIARVDNSNRLIISVATETVNSYVILTNGTATPLTDLGITSGQYYYAPDAVFEPSAGMPLWTASQAAPHPTGSVWVKTSVSGSGLNTVLSQYSSASEAFASLSVNSYDTLDDGTVGLDATGGQVIPTGTILQTTGNMQFGPSAVMYYVRGNTGPMVAYGTQTNPSVSGSMSLYAYVSTPGTATASGPYTVTFTGNATNFVLAWQSANIPNTVASLTATGEISLTHTLGGDITLVDFSPTTGITNGLLATLGFVVGENAIPQIAPFTTTTATSTTTGSGAGAQISITNQGTYYKYSLLSGQGGTNYAVGDLITITGTQLGGTSPANDIVLSVQTVNSGAITGLAYHAGVPNTMYAARLTNWEELYYTSNATAPATAPADGTEWFYSTATQVDIMVNKNGVWKGYGNVAFDNNGHPASSGPTNQTDPLGIICLATAPTTQVSGASLVPGDLWLDTSDLENYPMISRWQIVNGTPQWVLIDNTDSINSNGIVFADARWGVDGSVDPVSDAYSTISDLRMSDYTDLDAPNANLYPQGVLLFNTRRSGYNVKKFVASYFTQGNYPTASAYNSSAPATVGNLPALTYTWVSTSGLDVTGEAFMGRKAQRAIVVQALKAAINTNMSIREEDTFFNLIACPGYPELQPDMVSLNNDRTNTAYIVGDTPLRLADDATEITSWATNATNQTSTNEDGLVTRDEYLGVYYPSGMATDLTGASVVVPASHMMLSTFLQNDTIAYPWLAAAGTNRGIISNATAIGYIDSSTGSFVSIKNRQSIRDVLYTNMINPLAYFSGVGLLNYGNKNTFESNSAMDRTNVARLVAYIRYRLQGIVRPFVFEPNDALTRSQVAGVVQSLFVDLVAKRGLYDYLVVCDETNNTPARIDANELWIDVAIEPVIAAEFIYIPVRILNTGGIASLTTA